MPLNHADVALMMEGISAPGNAALQVRAQQQQAKRDEIEKILREKQLEIEQRRSESEDARAKAEGEGKVTAFLMPEGASDDSAGMTYQGPPSGLQQFKDTVKAKTGKALVESAPRDKTPPFGFEANLPTGKVTFHAHTIDELKTILNHPAMQGATPPGAAPSYGPVVADTRAAALEEMADKLEESAASESDATSLDRQVMLQKAKKFRERAIRLQQPRMADPNQPLETGSTEVDDQGRPIKTTQKTYATRAQIAAGGAQPKASKVMDLKTAAVYLKNAGGDKDKARQQAIKDGYSLTPQ